MDDCPPANPEPASSLRERLIRNHGDAAKTREQRVPLYDTLCARLASGTAASKLGISVDIVAPGMRSCPYHFHCVQEEAFVILEGEGSLRVAGEMLALRAGDTVFIPAGPQYPHQIINTSTEPLKYLSISTRDRPEVVVYPDSGKYLVMADDGSPLGLSHMHRERDELDYWDAEP